jgi:hypothetical protein
METVFSVSCTADGILSQLAFDPDVPFNGDQMAIYLKRFLFVYEGIKNKKAPQFTVRRNPNKRNSNLQNIMIITVSKPSSLESKSISIETRDPQLICLEEWSKIVEWLKQFGLIDLEFFCLIVENNLNELLSKFKFDSNSAETLKLKKNPYGQRKQFVAKVNIDIITNKIESSVNINLNRRRPRIKLSFSFAPIDFLKIDNSSVSNLEKELLLINIVKDANFVEVSITNNFDWLSTICPDGINCIINDPGSNPADAVALFWDQARNDKFRDLEAIAATHDGQGLDNMSPEDVAYWTDIIDNSGAPADVQRKCMLEFEKEMNHNQTILCCASCGCRLMESMTYISLEDVRLLEIKDAKDIAAYNAIPNLYKAVHNVFQYKDRLYRVHERFLENVPLDATPPGNFTKSSPSKIIDLFL